MIDYEASGNYKSRFRRYKRNLRWKAGMRKHGSHGLIPCPDCGGDIQHRSPTDRSGDYWQCQGCRKTWGDDDQAMQELHPENVNPVYCPKCNSQMHRQENSPLYPEGAWECDNQRCWHMMGPGEMVPDTYQAPPDPDTGQSDLTLPEHWGKLAGMPPEMEAAADKLFAEGFRRAQADGDSDGAYKSMLTSLQLWPGLQLPFEQAKDLADHWKQKYDSMFLGADVNLGVPNDPQWS